MREIERNPARARVLAHGTQLVFKRLAERREPSPGVRQIFSIDGAANAEEAMLGGRLMDEARSIVDVRRRHWAQVTLAQ